VRVILTARAERILQSLSATHLREIRGLRPSLMTLLRPTSKMSRRSICGTEQSARGSGESIGGRLRREG
jgi:hypothetical protein